MPGATRHMRLPLYQHHPCTRSPRHHLTAAPLPIVAFRAWRPYERDASLKPPSPPHHEPPVRLCATPPRPPQCRTGVNCLTLSFDQLGWFKDYKIPRTPQQAVSPQLLRATLRGATFNGLVVQGPASMLLYLCMQRFGACT
jgi:hypothetical protein